MSKLSRRRLLGFGSAAIAFAAAGPGTADAGIPDAASLLDKAREAVDRHAKHLTYRDRIGIVDFSSASNVPRLSIVDLANGRSEHFLVAHGRGSDPLHTGWVSRLSNEPGSYASSGGAYVTGGYYVGAHGRSMRLDGLDANNSNAAARAIVVHAAWYASPEIARATGKLGRSEGCFAVAPADLEQVLERLGPGRLLFADKST
jgi:hypothetical protein